MAETKTGTTVPADHGAKASFPPFEFHTFPSQILWFVLFFGGLYIVLSRTLPKLGSVIEGRAAKIASDLETAAKAQQDAEAAGAAYEESVAKAKDEARQVAQETRNKLSAETDAKRQALESELNAKRAAASAQIAKTRDDAMANVSTIAQDAASQIVKQLTGREPDSASVASAVASLKLN